MTRTHTVTESPIGPLTLVATNGALCGLYMAEHRYSPARDTFGPADPRGLEPAVEQLAAYFGGELTEFDLPLAMAGTPFQQRVWQELRHIPFGETVTYGELAQRLGQPTASRAVGLANGKNPVSIVVPCHRVIGTSGSLTGYGGGLPRKRYLLDFEQGTFALL